MNFNELISTMKNLLYFFIAAMLLTACKKSEQTDSNTLIDYTVNVNVSGAQSFSFYEPNGKLVNYNPVAGSLKNSRIFTFSYTKGQSVRMFAAMLNNHNDEIEVVVTNNSSGEVKKDKKVDQVEISFTAN